MSIVTLKKITLIGTVGEKDRVLDDLQALGCLHVIPLSEAKRDLKASQPEHAESVQHAMRYLGDCPSHHYPVKKDEDFDLDAVVKAVLANQRQLRELGELKEALTDRIKALTPWGDFTLPALGELRGLRLWFYQIPARLRKKLPKEGVVWQEVHADNLTHYVVVLAEEEPKPDAMPVPRTHTGKLSLAELNEQLDGLEIQLEEARAERWSLTRWLYLLDKHALQAEDRASLEHVKTLTRDGDRLFGFHAWLPAQELERLSAYADGKGLALYAEDPAPEDQPPTLLSNPEGLAAGESLVAFYTLPSYRGFDPSVTVFFSFALFAAMIVSDAGYASLFGLLLLFNWRKLGKTREGRSWRGLALALVLALLVWGILAGGYFGLEPPHGSLLGHLRHVNVHDFGSMMRIAIGVGVIHLSLGNALAAWKLQGKLKMLTPLGWIAVLWGGYLLWLSAGAEPWASVTKAMLGLGLLAVLLTHSERPVRRPLIDIPLRLLEGAQGVTNVSKLFGDTLSYLRLFALGLAGASLAATFNNLAMDVMKGPHGLHLLSGLVILLIGHGLNLALGVLGAVVHGLRLNLIEFFNWGLSEEGYPYKAFFKKELRK